MSLDPDYLAQLLRNNEGTTLDFKREQYPFEKGDNETKSELLKDILAFANTDRQITAHILIGVEEDERGWGSVVGVSKHLDDAKLQQFVSKKTNRPVDFSYSVFQYQELEIGIIEIPVQKRPIFLRREFGKIKGNEVYVRRNSSTDIASPDEIFEMGNASQSAEGNRFTEEKIKKGTEKLKRRIIDVNKEVNNHVPNNDELNYDRVQTNCSVILCSIREVFGVDSEEEKNFKKFKISLLVHHGVDDHHKFNLWGEKTIMRLDALISQLEEVSSD